MASSANTGDAAGPAGSSPESCTRPGDEGTTTLVVMGVSGSGKSTVADELVRRTGWPFVEGDDLHPEANRQKMAGGHPLDDEDRWPWLRRIAGWIGEQEAAGRNAVVTCSALKRRYRDLLCDGHPSVRFVQLTADPDLLAARLEAREGHYMPASLLGSQLDTLQPLQADEPGIVVASDRDPRVVADHVMDRLRPPPGTAEGAR
ncbi:gluconokinase [Pseudonocardia acidicola]|uniref:Gluconokinase n=1 Tax=Pseudonocardia acidicola TaxID=2724939 RepID=A0ABX1SPD1_9PSEU|nr:gluconokinase [Pseudonocardia acidicola]NMI01999.1 gluconokinase [Pseudonocardia acidicola]